MKRYIKMSKFLGVSLEIRQVRYRKSQSKEAKIIQLCFLQYGVIFIIWSLLSSSELRLLQYRLDK